mgnify:CR=1 FL=1
MPGPSISLLSGVFACTLLPASALAQSGGAAELPDGEGKELVEAVCTASGEEGAARFSARSPSRRSFFAIRSSMAAVLRSRKSAIAR